MVAHEIVLIYGLILIFRTEQFICCRESVQLGAQIYLQLHSGGFRLGPRAQAPPPVRASPSPNFCDMNCSILKVKTCRYFPSSSRNHCQYVLPLYHGGMARLSESMDSGMVKTCQRWSPIQVIVWLDITYVRCMVTGHFYSTLSCGWLDALSWKSS